MDTTPNLPTPELPKPGSEKAGDARFEQLISIEKVNNSPQQALPTPQVTAMPTPLVPQVPQVSPSQNIQSSTTPIADDVDVIEKEWVKLAKDLVEKTKEDPYTQNKELSKVKATYVKKRWNKDIKLADG